MLARLESRAQVRALRAIALRESRVDPVALNVLSAIGLRSNAGRAQIGQRRIAEESGLCERTVRRRVRVLEAAGLVARARRGPRGLTRYTLPWAVPVWAVDAAELPALRAAGAVQTGPWGFGQLPLAGVLPGLPGASRPDRQGDPQGRPDPDQSEIGPGSGSQTQFAPDRPAPPARAPDPSGKFAPEAAPPARARTSKFAPVAGAPLVEAGRGLRAALDAAVDRQWRAPGRTLAAALDGRAPPRRLDPAELAASFPFLAGRTLLQSFLAQESTDPRPDPNPDPRRPDGDRDPPDGRS